MGRHDSNPEQARMLALMEGLDEMRENLKAMVAAVVADGFTEEQARDIVAGFWRMAGRSESQ